MCDLGEGMGPQGWSQTQGPAQQGFLSAAQTPPVAHVPGEDHNK